MLSKSYRSTLKELKTIKENGRWSQLSSQLEDDLYFFGKWKTTSSCSEKAASEQNILLKSCRSTLMELKTMKANGRRPQLSRQMEDNLYFFWKMEDDLNFLMANER